jgi:pantothenate kinase
VIVEGLYLLLPGPRPWGNLRDFFDEIWFVHTDIEIAVERLVQRNSAAFGWPLEKTRGRVIDVDKSNMRLILQSNPMTNAARVFYNS